MLDNYGRQMGQGYRSERLDRLDVLSGKGSSGETVLMGWPVTIKTELRLDGADILSVKRS